jgi:protease YdgD
LIRRLCRIAPLLLLLAASPLPGVGLWDGRVRVDAAARPWTAIARLQVPGLGRCSAALVGPASVLTSAHCLWSARLGAFVPPSSVHVLTRYDAGQYAGHVVATSYHVAAGFDPANPARTRAADAALVMLAGPLGQPGDALALADAALPADTPVMLGGYNQDRAEVLEADTACRVIADDGGMVEHDCGATYGTSGAPLLVLLTGSGWRIAGVQEAAFGNRKGGIAVGTQALQVLLAQSGAAP